MEDFVKTPNLPKHQVSLAIVDGRIRTEIQNKLYRNNINLIKTEKIPALYEAVSCHPDLQLHHMGGDKIILAPNVSNRFVYQLEEKGFRLIFGETEIGGNYPSNIAYNAARVGKNLICNKKYTDKRLIAEAEKLNLNIIDVKQGYSKCSLCVVEEAAVISSDDGILKACSSNGIDFKKIRSGNIALQGFDYGFIGGASGYLSSSELGFYGNISFHPDYDIIKDFLKKYRKKEINLGENLVYDYGTFIPLKEYSILNK